MTFDEYMKQVTVGIVPEAPVVTHRKGGLEGTQLFLLRTIGMDKFDRPDLEMINVPALAIQGVGKTINHWAHYSITEKELKAGETLIIDHGMPLLIRMAETDDPGVLRLVVEAIQFQCCFCGEDGTCAGEDGVCTCGGVEEGDKIPEPSPTLH